jgi:predicted TIM-barrel fold metal-dependent hydrolase
MLIKKSALQTSRRRFLKSAGLVIVFALPSAQRLAQAATAAEFRPSAYLRIGDDDRIAVVVGIFYRFPKLQIVIGHMGEGLPFFMQRVPAKRWLDNVPVSPADKIKIMHGNADRLLKLDQLA